jgi:hypothetical protein
MKPYHRCTILLGPGWREIHSSEWRKPSEVSLRLRIVLSYMAGGLAPVLKSEGYSEHDEDQRVLDSS